MSEPRVQLKAKSSPKQSYTKIALDLPWFSTFLQYIPHCQQTVNICQKWGQTDQADNGMEWIYIKPCQSDLSLIIPWIVNTIPRTSANREQWTMWNVTLPYISFPSIASKTKLLAIMRWDEGMPFCSLNLEKEQSSPLKFHQLLLHLYAKTQWVDHKRVDQSWKHRPIMKTIGMYLCQIIIMHVSVVWLSGAIYENATVNALEINLRV